MLHQLNHEPSMPAVIKRTESARTDSVGESDTADAMLVAAVDARAVSKLEHPRPPRVVRAARVQDLVDHLQQQCTNR